jgi:anti-sigma B factor antagonist
MPEHTVSLTLDVARTDSTIIVHCHGKLVAGVDDILYRTIKPLLPDAKRVVLDLTDLTRVDSMGLGVLVRLYVAARSAGCAFELINLGKQVRMLIKTANLTAAFSIVGEHGIKFG